MIWHIAVTDNMLDGFKTENLNKKIMKWQIQELCVCEVSDFKDYDFQK